MAVLRGAVGRERRRRLLPGDLPRRPARLPEAERRRQPARLADHDRPPQGDRPPPRPRPPAAAGGRGAPRSRSSDPAPDDGDLGGGRRPAAEAAGRGDPALRQRPPPRRDRRRARLLARGRAAQPARGTEATEKGAGMKACARTASPSAPPRRACSTSPTRPPTRPSGRCCWRRRRKGLVRVGLPNQDADELLVDLATRVSPRVLEAPAQLDEARRELDLYFEGKLTDFDLPLDWQLSEGFRRRVLRAIARIPYGADPQLHGDGDQRRQRARGPRRRHRLRPQPDPARRPLPPGPAQRRRPRRLRRRAADEAGAAASSRACWTSESAQLKGSHAAGPIQGACDGDRRFSRRPGGARRQARLVGGLLRHPGA